MSGRNLRALRALAAILALLLVGGAALAGSIEVRLNDTARVYQALSASARSVKAPKGLRVSLKAYAKGWGKVTYKGRTGFIRLKYLDRVDPLRAYVTQSTPVYRDASSGKKLGNLATGAQVYAIGVDGGYVRILNSTGKWRGYIKAGVLSAGKPASAGTASGSGSAGSQSAIPDSLRATAEGAAKSRIEKTIFVAQNLIGTAYAESANPPKTFDCAKYTFYCYGKAGGRLKSSSKTQGYDDDFERVDSVSTLKRGDLVGFNTVDDNDLCDHVGIYLGGGYFVHASSVARQVIVSQLNSGYYNRVFSWGRRIFP